MDHDPSRERAGPSKLTISIKTPTETITAPRLTRFGEGHPLSQQRLTGEDGAPMWRWRFRVAALASESYAEPLPAPVTQSAWAAFPAAT